MDFSLTEEQEMLRKSARDFLTAECPKSLVREIEEGELGYSPELWKKMAGLGWMGLVLPEEYGGAGFSLLDMAVLYEEFGRAAAPGPMFSTIALGALPILDFGTVEQKKEILPAVAAGEAIMTMAISEEDVNEEPKYVATRAEPSGDGFAISGTKLFVPFADVADYVLVVARTEGNPGDQRGITVFIVDPKAQGISLTPLVTIAADRQFEVVFNKVQVAAGDILGSLHEGVPLLSAALRKATAIQCAMMVGGAQQEMELTAEHTKTRVQFNRPLGAFQAVQHRLADMYIDVHGARWTTYQAVWRLSEGLPAYRELAIAKAFTNIACQRVAASAQQLHGGVGVDKDYDLHYYFRRAKGYQLTLGSTPFHLKTLEAEIEA
jgi:alkylation response protein AidB-like acyl-CoA dehydrogenase